jgi:hypothetical protein
MTPVATMFASQGDCDISSGQTLTHYAGTDDAAATRNAVPTASAAMRRARVMHRSRELSSWRAWWRE